MSSVKGRWNSKCRSNVWRSKQILTGEQMTGKSVLACLLHHEDRADVNYHKMKETRNETIMPIPKGRGTANVHFGEKLKEGRIDQKPPGTVRYGVTPIRLGGQRGKCELFAAKEMMDD